MLAHGAIPCGVEVQVLAIAATLIALSRPYISMVWAAMRAWIQR